MPVRLCLLDIRIVSIALERYLHLDETNPWRLHARYNLKSNNNNYVSSEQALFFHIFILFIEFFLVITTAIFVTVRSPLKIRFKKE